MRRIAIGSIAIVLLASLQCEPQETKAGPLARLRQTSIVIEPFDADAKALGLSKKSLESQMLVGLRRDIPRLAVRESASPYLYLRVTVVRRTTVGGQERGFAVFVNLAMVRPVAILEDVGVGEVTSTVASVWDKGTLLSGGSGRTVRQLVKESINEKLTEFAADYYRQNAASAQVTRWEGLIADGGTAYHAGRYAEAEKLFLAALKEAEFGEQDPRLATSLNNLALLYKTQGKYTEAEPLYRRALAIREKALGPEHPRVATSLNNLAALYREQGKYAQAEPLYRRSLAIWEKALGPEHPQVATSLNNLVLLYYTQGKYAEAEALYARSLPVLTRAVGPDHPNVATMLGNYANLLRRLNRHDQAEKMEARAQAIRAKHAQDNPPK